MKVALIVIAVLIVLFCAVCAVFASFIVHGRRQTLDQAWKWQQEHVRDASRITRDLFTDYIVKSSRNEDIHVSYLPAPEAGNRYVVLAHGYTDNRFGMLKYAVHYRRLGFNCVMFDERGHGENAAEPCSYSVREVDFLVDVIEDTAKRYGPDIVIGIHGESLGASTVLMSLKNEAVKKNVSFAVEDCAFADIITVFKGSMKKLHVPGFMVYPTDIAARIMYGISFKAAEPAEAVKQNTIPLLCVHGAADDFIVPEHCRRIYENNPGEKEMRLVDNAGHAASAIVDPDGYFEMLKNFIEKTLGD